MESQTLSRSPLTWGFLVCWFVLITSMSFAQLPTAAISGQVRDASGAAIPNATITATNRETGLSRSTVTSAGGRYSVPALPVGIYDIRAEAPAFRPELQQNLTLTVGQEAVLNFSLAVGSVTETVTVMAEAPLVETTSGSLGGLVDMQSVSDLPLNGRNFNELVLTQTGITVHRPTSTTSTTATGLAYSSNGAPIRSNNIMMDGASMVAGGGINGVSVSGSMLGIEGIREFRVLTNSFPAEYGMTMGSQTTVVSKGGTNEVHGTLFEFLRNSALDARDFFDRKNRPDDPRIPAFRRNNFGGSVGGPIREDKLFFFATYEGVRESKGITQTLTVPAASQRTAVPSAQPYLNLFPVPTEPLFEAGTGLPSTTVGRFSYVFKRPTREEFGQVRGDYNISEEDTAFARYTIVDSQRTNGIGYPQFADFATSRGQYLTLNENHTFSSSLLNMFRLAFSRSFQNYLSPSDLSLGFQPGLQMGSVNPGSSITSLGPSGQRPLTLNQNQYSLGNDVFWSRGAHSVKFGVLLNRFHVYTNVNTNRRGTYAFANLAAFLQGNPRQLTILTPGSITDRTYRWNTYGFYVQDDWRAARGITLNLGLRYEFISTVNETKGRGSSLRDVQNDRAFTVSPELFDNPSLKNFSPRFGFAWDVFGNASMSVRGGFGLLYDVSNITGAAQINATATPPFSSNNTFTTPATAVTFPFFPIPSGTEGKALRLIDFHLQQPHMLQYNLTVEHQLPGNMVVTAGYAGSRGINLYGTRDGNPTYPSGTLDGREFWTGSEPRFNPFWADMEFITAGMNSWYNSLQLGFEKRMSRGIQFRSSYTWSKSLDTTQGQHGGESGGAPNQSVNPNNLYTDKGPSDFDTRHSWSFSVLYQLPAPDIGLVGKVLGGWRVGSILSAKTGLPFTPLLSGNRSRSQANGANADHPDVVAGRTKDDIILGGPNRYFDPTAFAIPPLGVLGNSGRNQFNGPNLVNLDFSLGKEMPLSLLGEAGRVEFRAELFNLLNHTNFNIPTGGRTVYTATNTTSDPNPLTGAGQIDRTIGSSRQVQLALKLIF